MATLSRRRLSAADSDSFPSICEEIAVGHCTPQQKSDLRLTQLRTLCEVLIPGFPKLDVLVIQ
ncbi:hypothetical protein GCM10009000_112740 [Halobacterium noricense]